MPFCERQTITMATTSGGVGLMYSGVVNGVIRHIAYTADGSVPYTGGTITISGETSGLTILVITGGSGTASYQPVATASNSADGTAMVYAAGGKGVPAPIYLANERVKFSLPATGGASKSGAFLLIIEGTFTGQPAAS